MHADGTGVGRPARRQRIVVCVGRHVVVAVAGGNVASRYAQLGLRGCAERQQHDGGDERERAYSAAAAR